MHLEAVPHAHAAAFIGRSPWDVSRDPILLADAHATAWRCYGHRMITPVIHPHVAEAEAWGLKLTPDESGECLAARRRVLERFEDLDTLPPLDPAAPPLQALLTASSMLARDVRDVVSVPVTGPFAIAEALVGRAALLEALARRSAAFERTLCALVVKMDPWIIAIGRAGGKVAVHEADYDPGLVSPEAYGNAVVPALRGLAEAARRATHDAPAILVDGDTAAIARHLCNCGAGYVACPESTSQTAFLAQIRQFPEVTVRVDLPRDLWEEKNWQAVCREIAARAGFVRLHERTILGTGPLPVHASSILVVDGCHFTTNMDPWIGSA
ncbi:MAG TPA: uroporphyrinogen decarboxylase family protein [Opitutaceae bacterium]